MKVQIREHVQKHQPMDILSFVRHLPNFVRLFVRLIGDRRVSLFAKGLLLAAGVYALSPLDFLPDMMPFLGQMDDLAIFITACRMFIQLCPRDAVNQHVMELDRSGKWNPFG